MKPIQLSIFGGIVDIVSGSGFYRDYLSKWPAPFNIVSFDAVLLCILLFMFFRWVWDTVDSYRYQVRFRAKQQQLQEERLEHEIREREKEKQRSEDDEMIRQYLKFMLTASAKNMIGMSNISLEEFKEAFNSSKTDNNEEETVYDVETEKKPEPAPEPYEEEMTYEEEEPEEEYQSYEMPEPEEEVKEETSEGSTFADVINSFTETTETPSEPEPVTEPVPEKPEEKKDIVSEILKNNNISDDDGSLKESVSEGMEDSEFLNIMKSITKTQKVKSAAEKSAKLKEKAVKDKTEELEKSLKKSMTNKDSGTVSKKTDGTDEIEDRKREAARLRELEEEKQRKLEEKRKLREEKKGKGIGLFKKK